MIRQHKKMILLTSIITLFPIFIGLLLWNQLPDSLATHWGINNEPNGYASKTFAVFGKFYTESKAKLYDWISDFVGIMRSGKLVSHASVWRKMHGDRWDYHDCYSTIPKYVDTYCTYSRPLHFTGNLFLSVLPQDNFIIMLFHFTFNQRVICPLIFSSFIQRNYRWQVVYILFMQCMVCV